MDNSLLSVVIVTWNSRSLVECCLGMIGAAAGDVPFELVIIDNGSVDGTGRWLETGGAKRLVDAAVTHRLNRRNLGVARARNQGIGLSSGDFICLLDADTEPQRFSLQRLVKILDSDPRVGLAGPRLVHPDGSLQYSCRRFPGLPDKLGRRLPAWLAPRLAERARRVELREWDHEEMREVDYVIGACQMLRRAALRGVGLLDERIFYGPEDVDLCLRLWRNGWKVLYAPDSLVVHHERRLTRRLLSRLTLLHAAGLAYYFAKHRYLLRPPVVRPAATAGDGRVAEPESAGEVAS